MIKKFSFLQKITAFLIISAIVCPTFVAAGDTNSKNGKKSLTETQKIIHVLNRLCFGVRPRDIKKVKSIGIDKYIEQQFWLAAKDKSRLPLRWVGMTVDTQSVTIYQEAEQATLANIAAIHHGVLADFLPEQVNTVNLNEGGAVRSLTFGRDNAEQPAR